MDLRPSDADAAVRAEAGAWLEAWLSAPEHRTDDPRLDLEWRSAYQRDAYDAGWLVPSWPLGEGGRGVGPEAELWIKLDFARRGAPKLPNVQGPGVVAHALNTFGSDEQRAHVRAVARGDVWWCLGMSEPQAGSDLASMRTRARRTDGGFTIDGQKVWTSHARDSSHCLLFARTASEGPPHRGISAFVVPMETPGITVVPIEKIGVQDEEFCEVFFDDVQVPESALLGPEHQGWKVAMESLGHERDMIWIMNLVEIEAANELTREALRARPRPELTLEYAAVRGDADAIWLTGLRGLASRVAGRPDLQTPLLKLFSTETAQRAFLLARRAAGLDAPERVGSELLAGEIEALGATLYGGTSEIQRNIVGERILGLPR
ncbi:acyl-CoA dehydrogenase family protein [Conexibacter stalactiti]|uniref:Acyl-CoA dehydrogenase family protein n=1 Tax=Conexibacter stalactiti TaxID=1940611 RepID=A0ABU4HLU0_9ACTN|nr:acyl-CoA dehydrogenase family protein [Conexibacter stalactiti]MDW5594257.1 acyl-CoA dehydrogenase family protein [Conexibacter stalactiti]MEC5034899.1 acyl-CoA dehydrogenase family protein [Conexibacter stalactiti]